MKDHRLYISKTFRVLDQIIVRNTSGKRRQMLAVALRNCKRKIAAYQYFPAVWVTLEVYRQFSRDMDKVVPLLAACSALHLGADLNDDFADDDLPDYWRELDKGVVVLLSYDIFHFLRSEAINMLKEFSVKGSVVNFIRKGFDNAAASMLEGQYMDICFDTYNDFDIGKVIRSIDGKSGKQIWAFCRSAALLGGATRSLAEKMGLFGRNLAVAAQITSDCNDIWGKPASPDLKNGRLTIPLAYALGIKRRKNAVTKLLSEYRRSGSKKSLAQIRKALSDSGALLFSALRAQTYVNMSRKNAKEALGSVPPSLERILQISGLS